MSPFLMLFIYALLQTNKTRIKALANIIREEWISPLPHDLAKASRNLKANALGNITNRGLAAQDGDIIYYANANDAYSLYKKQADSSDPGERISDTKCENIIVVGDWLYYIDMVVDRKKDSNHGIYRMKNDGSSQEKIYQSFSRCWINGMIAYNGWLYYAIDYEVNPKHAGSEIDGIYRIRLDGKYMTCLASGMFSYVFAVKDNWIYTLSRISQCICKIQTKRSLNTDEFLIRFLFLDNSLTNEYGYSEWLNCVNSIIDEDVIYFVHYYGIYNCMRFLSLEKNNYELWEWDKKTFLNETGYYRLVKCINMHDGWIYYINVEDECRLYKIRTDGTENTRMGNEHFGETEIDDDFSIRDNPTYINIAGGNLFIYYDSKTYIVPMQ